MAKYEDDEKQITVNLLSFGEWSIVNKGEYDYEDLSYDELLDEHIVALNLPKGVIDITEVFTNGSATYPDLPCERIELKFMYATTDVLKMHPIADCIYYPDNEGEISYVELGQNEKRYFTGLLDEAIGDKHSPEMQVIMENYHNSVDAELKAFVRDVISGRDVLPLTVGFIDERMAKDIQVLTGLNTLGNRIVVGADDIRHVLSRHGASGKADHSMQNIDDIARLCYVLANYDTMEWDGGVSNLYKTKDGKKAPQLIIKKRIDGTYYIVEVASDSSKNRNVVSTIYLKKATD